MASPNTTQLQFCPFNSALDTGFWYKLSEKKLNEYGLDDKSKPLEGYYCNGDAPGLTCRLSLDYSSFDVEGRPPPRCFPVHGTLKNTNTIDELKTCDKKALLDEQAEKLWDDITSGRAVQNPSLLSRFHLLSFADLKKYHYYYWFAFPALCTPDVTQEAQPISIDKRFTDQQVAGLLCGFDEYYVKNQCGFFLARQDSEGCLHVHALAELDKILMTNEKWLLCFCDPCTLETHPSWPLRNLLALVLHHWGSTLPPQIEVLCLRDRFRDGERSVSHSLVLKLNIPQKRLTECPQCVGWEKNERQKMGPRLVNLSSSMDPARLAESAVDLNLKLMRWRLMPELDLDLVSSTRCLLLGSGTLGCNVARALLGWGVRNITLVDNGRVSYSNPVRQSLFCFDDSMDGGREKAQAAAESLKKIFPGVNAVGVTLSVPMPGHPVAEGLVEQTHQEVDKLEALLEAHDVVFLLLDTRESRWLPTLLATAKHKIVINAALGFDSYLVMRHGVRDETSIPSNPSAAAKFSQPIAGSDLGCYFCNDVVAPGNSTRDRTLDQQCTVSRPGVSMMAASLAVELLVSVLVHPNRGGACADTCADDYRQSVESPLGIVPHQIRGFLSRFHQVMPACQAFDKCTACSALVVNQYKKEGFTFLLEAFNDPKYLENLTGLTELHQQTMDDEVWELSDDDSSYSME